jgi:hypothetical protein
MQGAAKITYDYSTSLQTKHYFDKDNKPIESGGVFAAQYSLDPKGTYRFDVFRQGRIDG